MKLIYGTGNPAKLAHMRNCLSPLGLEIVGLADVACDIGVVEESGAHPLDNARIKAWAYYRELRLPVFSCDSGLYIEGLPTQEQPGVHVRTVGGVRLSDAQMVEHYLGIARHMGGRAVARYRNAVCLVLDEHMSFEYFGEDIASKRFLLVAEPHPLRTPGFPLDSLSARLDTGKYYNDSQDDTDAEEDTQADGFRRFFRESLRL